MEARLSADVDVVYAFGKYRFLPRRQLLICGEAPVRVGARALDLLQLLIERQGELVSKSDLIRFAWPDIFVHESNLKVNIAALRRALQQDRNELPYIVTVSGRGYRFTAPARLETTPGSTLTVPSGGTIHRQPAGAAQPAGARRRHRRPCRRGRQWRLGDHRGASRRGQDDGRCRRRPATGRASAARRLLRRSRHDQ